MVGVQQWTPMMPRYITVFFCLTLTTCEFEWNLDQFSIFGAHNVKKLREFHIHQDSWGLEWPMISLYNKWADNQV